MKSRIYGRDEDHCAASSNRQSLEHTVSRGEIEADVPTVEESS